MALLIQPEELKLIVHSSKTGQNGGIGRVARRIYLHVGTMKKWRICSGDYILIRRENVSGKIHVHTMLSKAVLKLR